MRTALISDIHSNLEALTEVVDYCSKMDIDQYICLGDIIGYGADPNPCCEILREIAAVTLLGNHDAAVIGVMDTDYYYEAAKQALFWTREHLTKENFDWLYTLPYTYREENLGFFHAAPILPSGFYYVVTTADSERHLAVYNRLEEFNFCGHSHLTNKFLLSPDEAKEVPQVKSQSMEGHKWLINVGSVGQPRDRDNRSCFGIFDSETQTFEHVRTAYDIDTTADKIRSAGLDEKFAARLFAGM